MTRSLRKRCKYRAMRSSLAHCGVEFAEGHLKNLGAVYSVVWIPVTRLATFLRWWYRAHVRNYPLTTVIYAVYFGQRGVNRP